MDLTSKKKKKTESPGTADALLLSFCSHGPWLLITYLRKCDGWDGSPPHLLISYTFCQMSGWCFENGVQFGIWPLNCWRLNCISWDERELIGRRNKTECLEYLYTHSRVLPAKCNRFTMKDGIDCLLNHRGASHALWNWSEVTETSSHSKLRELRCLRI